MVELPVFYCPRCGFRGKVNEYYWRCPRCGSPLELEYEAVWSPRGSGVARYSTSLPFTPPRSLGEGNTPLVEVDYRGIRVKFKLEYLNPTGSFKDRGSSLAVGLAFLLGYRRVVEDTSGNTGISVAAYARLYGLRATIVMPEYAPKGKKVLVKALGGEIVETPTRGDAALKVLELAASEGNYYVAHTYSPLYVEGAKTVAYESWEQGFNGDIVVAPVGSGGLFLGLHRGFSDLEKWGLRRTSHKMIAVEGSSVIRLYDKLYGSKPSLGGGSRLADGIMVPKPPRLDEILGALKSTHGEVVVVNDEEILDALRELYDYGLIVEPTSATVLAAIKKLIDQGKIGKGEEVLAPLTGSGLKMIDLLEKLFKT
ncbi:MAG: L-threonine synthase [Thermoprotei archaeon]|nr:MAG: L-threonine synthase [Thermoprotei archaeon]